MLVALARDVGGAGEDRGFGVEKIVPGEALVAERLAGGSEQRLHQAVAGVRLLLAEWSGLPSLSVAMVATISSAGTVKRRAAVTQWAPNFCQMSVTVEGSPVVPTGAAPSTEIPSGVSAQVTLLSTCRCWTESLRSASTITPGLAAVVGAGSGSGAGASAAGGGGGGAGARSATCPISSVSFVTNSLIAWPFSLEPWLLPQ